MATDFMMATYFYDGNFLWRWWYLVVAVLLIMVDGGDDHAVMD